MDADFENPIDKIIREARERGDFDQLPGKGKPLQWDDDSMVPDDQRTVQRLLKNNGYTLDWIQIGKDRDDAYEALRGPIEQVRAARASGQLDGVGWQSAMRDFVTGIRKLNQRVTSYNLRVPNEHFQRRPFPIEPDLLDV